MMRSVRMEAATVPFVIAQPPKPVVPDTCSARPRRPTYGSIVRPEITRRPLMGQLSDGEMRAHPAEEVRIGITALWRSSDFMLLADHDDIGVFADDGGPHRPGTVRGGQV